MAKSKMKSMMGSANGKSGFGGPRNRKLLALDATSECNDLYECAGAMSLYDLVAFMYNDNIDEDGTGDISDSTWVPPGDDPITKAENINAILADLTASDGSFSFNSEHCDSLLEQFHRNFEFTVNGATLEERIKPASVAQVCYAVNNPTYAKIESIADEIDPVAADIIFEDLYYYTVKLVETIKPDNTDFKNNFPFGVTNAFIPEDVNSDSLDVHGYPKDDELAPKDFFGGGSVSVLKGVYNNLWPDGTSSDNGPVSNWLTYFDGDGESCDKKVSRYYTQRLLTYSPGIKNIKDGRAYDEEFAIYCRPDYAHFFNNDDTTYCQILSDWTKVGTETRKMKSVTIENDKNVYYDIERTVDLYEGTEICHVNMTGGTSGFAGGLCARDDDYVAGWCFQTYKPVSPFRDGDRDLATSLVFGDSVSPGLVGAYAEAAAASTAVDKSEVLAGYCCLDRPWESSSWGTQYTCDMTCQEKGPLLSGFSEEACNIYSGTFCSYPRECSVLQECVQSNVDWATNSTKMSFRSYLEAAPEITDATDDDECGFAKEYFGYDQDYPSDQDICDQLFQMRDFGNFDFIDQFFKSDEASGSPGSGLSAQGLDPPSEPTYSESEGSSWARTNHQYGQVVSYLSRAFDFLWTTECLSENLVCKVVLQLAIHAVLSELIVAEKALEASEYAYSNEVTIGDYQMNQMYEHVMVMYPNMGILADGIGETFEEVGLAKEAILDASEDNKLILDDNNLLLGDIHDAVVFEFNATAKFAGCDGADQDNTDLADNCEEDQYPPSLILPQSTALAKNTTGTYTFPDMIFGSIDEAKSFLEGSVGVEDDCAHRSDLDVVVECIDGCDDNGACYASFEATAKHETGCDRAVGSVGDTKTFVTKVDRAPPTVSCFFGNLTDEDATVSDDGRTLFLDEDAGPSHNYIDVNFGFETGDNCDNDHEVKIEVTSNERESDEEPVFLHQGFYTNSDEIDVVVGVHPDICSRTSKVFDCMIDPNTETRLYDITVSATDNLGWETAATCTVIIVPKDTFKRRRLNNNNNIARGEEGERNLKEYEPLTKEEQIVVELMVYESDRRFDLESIVLQ